MSMDQEDNVQGSQKSVCRTPTSSKGGWILHVTSNPACLICGACVQGL